MSFDLLLCKIEPKPFEPGEYDHYDVSAYPKLQRFQKSGTIYVIPDDKIGRFCVNNNWWDNVNDKLKDNDLEYNNACIILPKEFEAWRTAYLLIDFLEDAFFDLGSRPWDFLMISW